MSAAITIILVLCVIIRGALEMIMPLMKVLKDVLLGTFQLLPHRPIRMYNTQGLPILQCVANPGTGDNAAKYAHRNILQTLSVPFPRAVLRVDLDSTDAALEGAGFTQEPVPS